MTALLPESRWSAHIQAVLKQRIAARNSTLLWECQVGEWINTPVVVDGIAYARSWRCLRAFNIQTGVLLWVLQAKAAIEQPAVVDGMVYIGSEDGHLRALDAKTGVLRWEFQSREAIYTPVVVDGIAYAGGGNREKPEKLGAHRLYALDAKTGNLCWDFVDKAIFQNPVVVDGIVYAGVYTVLDTAVNTSHLRAFDARSGALRWDFQEHGWPFGPNSCTLVVVDGMAYAGSSDGYLRAFDAQTGTLRWDFQGWWETWIDTPVVVDGIAYAGSSGGYLSAYHAKTGILCWGFQANLQAEWKSIDTPVVVDGIAYAKSVDHYLRAFDAKTGALRWDFQAGAPIDTPVVVEGTVYVGSADHHLRAFDAKTGALRWDFQAGAPIDTPVVVEGIVCVGSVDGTLRAFSGAQILSGEHTQEVIWGSSEQLYSYLIWGKPGLAARKIVEGYDLKAALKQSGLSRDDLATGLDQLAAGMPYYGVGALAEDSNKLRPPWFTAATHREGNVVRPAVALYLQAIKHSNDRAGYLAEAKRLAPNVNFAPWGPAAAGDRGAG